MGKSAVLGVVTMVVSFSVYEGSIDCYNDDNLNREGILGKNVTLWCRTSWTCEYVQWDLQLEDKTVDTLSEEQVPVDSRTSYLSIFGIGFHRDGLYRCWCYVGDNPSLICSITLKTVCQATVRLNGKTIFYNSSSPDSSFVDATVGETITITCSEGATLERSCEIDLLSASDGPSTSFEVLQEHNSCSIECLLRSRDGDSCSVGFTLNVARLEKSTPHSTASNIISTVSSYPSVNENVATTTSESYISPVPRAVVTTSDKPSLNLKTSSIIPSDRSISATAYSTMSDVQQAEKDTVVPDKSGSFPVMLVIGISIAVFVGILFITCFFIYFSRSKSTSRQNKTQSLDNESPDTNIPIGPTYATVNRSSPGCTEGDDDSKRCIPCADDAYAEVDSSGKGESSTQQVNAVKEETSITKDYYSVVNTSNAKQEPMDSANKSDGALYTEVNKEDKQAGKKEGTYSPGNSDCNPNVPDDQSYDVLEQPKSSDYDDVSAASASPALYAVVDKERKEE